MNPKRIERGDLLDDPRFWALLYQYWAEARVGDRFRDGTRHFFSVPGSSLSDFFRELEGGSPGTDTYPAYPVLLTLRNRWRIGVVLKMYPEDFAIEDVVSPPSTDELIVFGVNGGNSMLPALRWEELLAIREAVVPPEPDLKAKAALLLFPAVGLSSGMRMGAVRRVLQHAWVTSGIPVRHAAELVARPIDDFVACRRQYPDVKETVWRRHPRHGWANDSHHSLRNPTVEGAGRVLPAVRRLFSTLERRTGPKG